MDSPCLYLLQATRKLFQTGQNRSKCRAEPTGDRLPEAARCPSCSAEHLGSVCLTQVLLRRARETLASMCCLQKSPRPNGRWGGDY